MSGRRAAHIKDSWVGLTTLKGVGLPIAFPLIMNSELLAKRIANVFSTKPIHWKDDDILYADAYKNDEELEEIKGFFQNRSWESITPMEIFRFRHALSFFSPKALVYYMPAWLTNSLLDRDTVDTAVEDVSSILASGDASLWTQPQRAVLCDWLIHFKNCLLEKNFEMALSKLGCA